MNHRHRFYLTKDEAAQFVPEPFRLARIFGTTEAFRELEKSPLALLVDLDTQLNQLDQNAIITQPPPTRDRFHLLCYRTRQGHAAPDLLQRRHSIIVHHYGAFVWQAQLGLHFGGNDVGSVMLEENVVRAAGVTNCTTEEELRRIIREAGFNPVQGHAVSNLFLN